MLFGGYSHLSNVLEGPPKVSSCIYFNMSKLSMLARIHTEILCVQVVLICLVVVRSRAVLQLLYLCKKYVQNEKIPTYLCK